eukprot:364848-Chlamydomonas_euryale.AAC.5
MAAYAQGDPLWFESISNRERRRFLKNHPGIMQTIKVWAGALHSVARCFVSKLSHACGRVSLANCRMHAAVFRRSAVVACGCVSLVGCSMHAAVFCWSAVACMWPCVVDRLLHACGCILSVGCCWHAAVFRRSAVGCMWPCFVGLSMRECKEGAVAVLVGGLLRQQGVKVCFNAWTGSKHGQERGHQELNELRAPPGDCGPISNLLGCLDGNLG